jgi:small subunit ribosomal protein S4
MGDPRTLKKKYESPRRVLDAERIANDTKLRAEYGLKTTREVWTTLQELKKVRRAARALLSLGEAGKEKGQKIIDRLVRLGVAKPDATIDSLLSLDIKDFLERRLQTRVLKRSLARTPKQARQLITHGFIAVNGRRVSAPSYFVTVADEPTISYFKPINIEVKEAEGAIAPSSPGEESHEAAMNLPGMTDRKKKTGTEGAAPAAGNS